MRKVFSSAILILLSIISYCQTKDASNDFNFDCETIENGKPKGWFALECTNCKALVDSSIVRKGKYSLSIEYDKENTSFHTWNFVIPKSYHGKWITMSGYIKTQNVTNGYAGLWMRINPNINFDYMANRGVKGTTDWTKYEISLKMHPSETKQIVFGGLLTGKGKMWIDDFQVTHRWKKH